MKTILYLWFLCLLALLFAAGTAVLPFPFPAERTALGFAGAALLAALPAVWGKIRPPVPDHGRSIDEFRHGVRVLAGAFALGLLEGRGAVLENTGIAYAALYLTASVLLLRLLRARELGTGARRAGLRVILPLAGLIVLLSLPVMWHTVLPFLWRGGVWAVTHILLGAAWLLAWIFWGLWYLLQLLFGWLIRLLAGRHHAYTPPQPPGIPHSPLLQNPVSHALPNTGWLRALPAVVTAALLLGGAVLAVWRLSRLRPEAAEKPAFTEIRRFRPRPRGPRARNAGEPLPPGPGGEIRLLYRRFLRRCRRQGVEIRPGDTTRRIAEKCAELYDPAALGRIREIYRRARYRPAAMRPEDVREFRALLRGLKKNRPEGPSCTKA